MTKPLKLNSCSLGESGFKKTQLPSATAVITVLPGEDYFQVMNTANEHSVLSMGKRIALPKDILRFLTTLFP
ncbi:MAG TPA: hypothetical protein VE130_15025 [Nitrososphaeraceae archaeon]|nr:hypothetical protein [Nitrososphaeraceae archaeon]